MARSALVTIFFSFSGIELSCSAGLALRLAFVLLRGSGRASPAVRSSKTHEALLADFAVLPIVAVVAFVAGGLGSIW